MVKITSVLAAAVFAASTLCAPVASAQRGVGHVEPMPRIEPMPDYSPPQDTQISRDRDWDRPTIQIPPPCSNEDALAGRCAVVARLPRCPGDPRCPRINSVNANPGDTAPQP